MKNNVCIYIRDCNTITEDEIEIVKNLFPMRYEEIMKYKFENDRKLGFAATLLMHNNVGVPDELKLYKNEYGKLYSVSGDYFNISHSGIYAVCSCAPYENGIDIEQIGTYKQEVAEKLFSLKEIKWMNKSPEERFYTLWTAKESVIKCMGKGFYFSPAAFEVPLNNINEEFIIEGKSYYIHPLRINNYKICVCSVNYMDKIQIELI